MKHNKTVLFCLVISSAVLLSGCGSAKKDVSFSNDNEQTDSITPYEDILANTPINITQNYNLNQEFKADFRTQNPDGKGTATFKAKSIKEIPQAGKRNPDDGKKLILLEIAVKGDRGNKGEPGTFNQVGSNPSPQFVLIDKTKNKTYVEETYYSDGYTADKNLFELSKITTDQDQWVNTAIVFQVEKNLNPDLAFRFINTKGKAEFYAVK